MSFDEKDGYDKVGTNGIQASSGPAYGADAQLPKSDLEHNGVEGTFIIVVYEVTAYNQQPRRMDMSTEHSRNDIFP
jgi:hypothetical protein